jgi:DNA-binding NarL/FixJ family response regulator
MTIRILLADDSQVYRRAIGAMLSREPDLQVVGDVGDGHAAVAAVLQIQPDIVLMDVGMPEIDGIDATRAIAAQAPSVQVLALSLHADAAVVQAMVEAGARGYALKEDAFTDLVQAIHEVAAGRAYFSPNLLTGRNNGAVPPD